MRWSQTPSPLAYAVYAFINVDNCERPLNATRKMYSMLNQFYSCILCQQGKTNFYVKKCSILFGPSTPRKCNWLFKMASMKMVSTSLFEELYQPVRYETFLLFYRPSVVRVGWLLDSFQQGRCVTEDLYACFELPPLDSISPCHKQ